ncbi:MAG: hypothetical protein GC134_09295 [Proteobacteria bacterium]|nr:hypothetical protein [Pseudomonadota bacterium]
MTTDLSARVSPDVTLRHITFAKGVPVPLTHDELDEAFLATKAGQRYKYALDAFVTAWAQHEAFMASRPTGERSSDSASLDLHGQLTASLVLGDAARKLIRVASSRPVRLYAARRRGEK